MKIAYLFSGQGAQYPGMMKDLAVTYEVAKEFFNNVDIILERNISDLCFKGSQEELNITQNTQPCVLAADLAAYAVISAFGIKPDAVAGFSLGEYAALVAAGVITIENAFPIVQKRAIYMQEAVPVGTGAMAAIMNLSEEDVQELCDIVEGFITPTNYNCPGQIVVSGTSDAVDQLCTIAKEKKIKALKLPVSGAFHCKLMIPAVENLRKPLAETSFSAPIIPIYMNVDANPEDAPDIIREKLLLQTKSPVMWERILRNMYRDGIDTFIELGPGKTLTGFVKKTFNNGENISFLNVSDVKTLQHCLSTLGGRRWHFSSSVIYE